MANWNVLVTFDTTSSGHKRITHGKCARAVVRQPWMTDAQWDKPIEEFVVLHSKCERGEVVAST